MTAKLNRTHFERRAFVYVRQSTAMQVHEHVESKQRHTHWSSALQRWAGVAEASR
jgi:hypothetical protein